VVEHGMESAALMVDGRDAKSAASVAESMSAAEVAAESHMLTLGLVS
jgi:hypothetical protein